MYPARGGIGFSIKWLGGNAPPKEFVSHKYSMNLGINAASCALLPSMIVCPCWRCCFWWCPHLTLYDALLIADEEDGRRVHETLDPRLREGELPLQEELFEDAAGIRCWEFVPRLRRRPVLATSKVTKPHRGFASSVAASQTLTLTFRQPPSRHWVWHHTLTVLAPGAATAPSMFFRIDVVWRLFLFSVRCCFTRTSVVLSCSVASPWLTAVELAVEARVSRHAHFPLPTCSASHR